MDIGLIKRRAKESIKRNYWPAVIGALLITASVATPTAVVKVNVNDISDLNVYIQQAASYARPVFGTSIVALLVKVFLLHPLEVGGRKFFFDNGRNTASLNEVSYAFGSRNYFNVVLTMFVRDIFNSLWFLLFVIPGFIKVYSYRLVPYILFENPGIDPMTAITRSREMMNGHKMEAFLLDLSFIGWFILGVLSLGLGLFFWVSPYMSAAQAEFYRSVRQA